MPPPNQHTWTVGIMLSRCPSVCVCAYMRPFSRQFAVDLYFVNERISDLASAYMQTLDNAHTLSSSRLEVVDFTTTRVGSGAV